MDRHDPDNPWCLAVPHTYWNYSIVWCGHRQSWQLSASRYLETGTKDDPVDYVTRTAHLGPFDNRRDAVALLTSWLNEDLPE
jgi:hypothetical protein